MKIISATPTDGSDFVAEVATYMGDASLHLFAIGFLEMAETSTEHLIRNQCSIDTVIPATLYSLRHSVELFLKYMLYELHVVTAEEPINGHDVSKLFENHRQALSIALDSEPETGFDWRSWMSDFESLVLAVHEIDPDGQAIRYPATKHLVPNHGGGYSISTRHLAACISKVRSVYQRFDERDC